jgi:hypothetical protein
MEKECSIFGFDGVRVTLAVKLKEKPFLGAQSLPPRDRATPPLPTCYPNKQIKVGGR